MTDGEKCSWDDLATQSPNALGQNVRDLKRLMKRLGVSLR